MRNYLQQYVHDLLCVLAFISLVASWFLLKRLPGWILSIRGANWPPTEGRIEITNVTACGEQALAELGYSYLVEAARYSGYFSQQFADEQLAWTTSGNDKVNPSSCVTNQDAVSWQVQKAIWLPSAPSNTYPSTPGVAWLTVAIWFADCFMKAGNSLIETHLPIRNLSLFGWR